MKKDFFKGEEPDYDDLVQAVQDGKITELEMIELLEEDIKEFYDDWLYINKKEATEESASEFLLGLDEYLTVELDGNLPARTAESLISGYL